MCLPHICLSSSIQGSNKNYPKFRQPKMAGLNFFFPLKNLKNAVCTSFGITPKQFYYVVARMNKQQPTLEEYIALIEKEGFEVYVSTEQREANQPPKSLIAVSPNMKKAFGLYGNRVSFDLTFRLIKNQAETGGTWKVGVFLGLSSACCLVPLGIAVVLETTKEAYA